MILSELKAYLKERGRAPMVDLVNRFRTEPEVLRGMLAHMIAKGRVRRLNTEAGDCGGCSKCGAFALEVYEWVGRTDP